MVNVAPGDVPPVVVTVTLAVPAVAIRLAGTVAVSWLALPKAVASAEPFQLTEAPATKFVPLIVSVNAALPAVAEPGLNPVIVGEGGLMVNVATLELPYVALTVMLALPAVAISVEGTVAETLVGLL